MTGKSSNVYRRKSEVWMYFTEFAQDQAKCDICKKTLSYKCGSTSNLYRHLRLRHSTLNLFHNNIRQSDRINNESQINPDENSGYKSSNICWRKSQVWMYFTERAPDKAKCDICKKILTYKCGSTFKLYRHLRNSHPRLDVFHKTMRKSDAVGKANEANPSQKNSINESSTTCRRGSQAWIYFTDYASNKAKCDICRKVLSYKGGSTSNLNRHLRNKHSILNVFNNSIRQSEPVNVKNQVTLDSNNSVDKLSNSCRRESQVWIYFTACAPHKAKCDICRKILSYKGGSTSNLNRHLRNKHPTLNMFHNSIKASDNVNAENQAHSEPDNSMDKSSNSCWRKSKVWMYFTEYAPDQAKCDICRKILSYKRGSTFNLNRHLQKQHPTLNIFPNNMRQLDIIHTAVDSDNSEDKSSNNCWSQIWMYFTEYAPDKVKCVKCRKILPYRDGSTLNLNRHLQLRHPTVNSMRQLDNVNVENQTVADSYILGKSSSSSRRESQVWMYFTECAPYKAKCGKCRKVISYKGGSTSNLNRHLRNKHPTLNTLHSNVMESDTVSTENQVNPYIVNSVEKSSNTCWRKSQVWMYFTEYAPDKAKCDKCRKVLSYKCGSTFNLSRHLRNRHPTLNEFYNSARQLDTINTENLPNSDPNNAVDNIQHNTCRKESQVWMYFTECAPDKAKCEKCRKILSFKCRSTSNLNRHLRNRHPSLNMLHNNTEESDSVNAENQTIPDSSYSVEKLPNTCWRKSQVWMYFTEYAPDKAKCDKCRKILSYKCGSTFNLNRHLRNRHPTLNVFHNSLKQLDVVNVANQTNSDPVNTVSKLANTCRRESQVWMYFTECTPDKAKCDICRKILSHKCGSTSNLNRHLRNRHPTLNVFQTSTREPDTINTENQASLEANKSSTPCRRKSQVWTYFTECGLDKAKCSICTKTLSYKCGSTFNLNRHLRNRHPTLNVFHDSIQQSDTTNTENHADADPNSFTVSCKSANEAPIAPSSSTKIRKQCSISTFMPHPLSEVYVILVKL